MTSKGKKICSFFVKGKCTKGRECPFLHVNPSPQPVPSVNQTGSAEKEKEVDCKFFLRGNCRNGNACKFKHPEPSAPGNGNLVENPVLSTKFNKKQLIIKNLSADTSSSDIRNYLLKLAGKSPSSVKFHHDNTKALAGFPDAIDIESLRRKMELDKSLQSLNGHKIELEGSPFCKCIMLFEIPRDATKDDVETEIQRIMGPDSTEEIDFKEGSYFAIITFRVKDLSKLQSTKPVVSGKQLPCFYYDESFVTRDIYRIINGQRKAVKLTATKRILDYLIEKEEDELKKILGTNDFSRAINDEGCLFVDMDNWTHDAEQKICDDFQKLVSEYESMLLISPQMHNLSERSIRRVCQSFKTDTVGVEVLVEDANVLVTGRIENVKRSMMLFHEMVAEEQELSKSKEFSKIVDAIQDTYSMFTRIHISDWLENDPKLANVETIDKVNTICKEFKGKEELKFFQTEAFNNCRHRILKDCSVVLATGSKQMENSHIEVFVGDICTVQSDVIVNSTSRTIGTGSALASSIRGAAGLSYTQECYNRCSETINVWDFKTTGGGNLNCKTVVHLNLGYSESEMFQTLVVKVLKYADSNGYGSVAIPLVGTGALNYSKSYVAEQLVKGVCEFYSKFPTSSLKKVILVAQDNEAQSELMKYASSCSSMSLGNAVSVMVTFLGIGEENLANAEDILRKCLDEQILLTGTQNGALSLPSSWEKMPLDSKGKEKPFHEVQLSQSSTEFKNVKAEIYRTSSGKIEQILEIRRIQNPQLYQSYMSRKQAMDKRNDSANNERSLYHGTTKESSELINHHGFNRSYAGKNAAAYGNGNYFAVNSRYSVSYARPDSNNVRRMYMAKVLVGEYTQGLAGMKEPPKKGYGTDLYDSVVDNVITPSIFVVFPDNHAYPEYLITFI